MPTISMFYGLIVRMYYFDNQQHNMPHIHVHYQDCSAIIEIPTGNVLEGSLQKTNRNWLMPGLKFIRKVLWPTGIWQLMVIRYSRLIL